MALGENQGWLDCIDDILNNLLTYTFWLGSGTGPFGVTFGKDTVALPGRYEGTNTFGYVGERGCK